MRLHTGGLYPQIGWRVSGKPELHSQLLAATTTTGGQDTTAILGGHAGTEAVHLAALTLLGLVGTEHGSTLLTFCVIGGMVTPLMLTSQHVIVYTFCWGLSSAMRTFFQLDDKNFDRTAVVHACACWTERMRNIERKKCM